jgi:hypothetical protein
MAGQEPRPPTRDQQALPLTPAGPGPTPATERGKPAPAASSVRSWGGALDTTRRRLAALFATLAALVGLATGVLEIKGALSDDVAVKGSVMPGAIQDSFVSVEQFARANPHWFGPGADPEALGGIFGVAVRTDGLEGEDVELRWQLQDALTSASLPLPRWARESTAFKPDRSVWRDSIEVWVPYPAVERFRVRFSIVHDDNVLGSNPSRVMRVGRF